MATQQTAMRITATTAQDRSTGLAACHLLLAVLIMIGFFATQALKGKSSNGKFRRATAFQFRVAPKVQCALFLGLLPSMGAVFSDKASLQSALTEWQNDQAAAGETHGPISAWDVSAVTDMSDLFLNYNAFDSDINAWDVSNTTNMARMFHSATAYNQPMDAWQVGGKVTNFYEMFRDSAFNQDISGWNISGATEMRDMFHGAVSLSDCNMLELHSSFKIRPTWSHSWSDRMCPPSTPPSPPTPPSSPSQPVLPPAPRTAGEGAVGDDPIFVGSDGVPYEVRGEPGLVFNLLSASAMSINAMFEAVPPKFQALDITDTVLGSVNLAVCATDISPLSKGGFGSLHFDVGSGNLSLSGAPIGAVFERLRCDLASMSCDWVPAKANHGSVTGTDDRQVHALALPMMDSGFARVRVRVEGAAGAVATITRHCMLSLDIDIECADFAEWPIAAAACGALLRDNAPADVREKWVMMLTLPAIPAEDRFCFMGLGLANVSAAPHEVHGLLGQRAAATDQLLNSASVSAHGVSLVKFGPEFGPQGEGAIEGGYMDYRRDALDAHDTPSPYNRFLRCGVV